MKLPLQHADIDMPRCRRDEYRANVDEIVRRVNAHEALVAALKQARADLWQAWEEMPDTDDGFKRIMTAAEHINEALKAAGEMT